METLLSFGSRNEGYTELVVIAWCRSVGSSDPIAMSSSTKLGWWLSHATSSFTGSYFGSNSAYVSGAPYHAAHVN
jgi:hypothetical protein